MNPVASLTTIVIVVRSASVSGLKGVRHSAAPRRGWVREVIAVAALSVLATAAGSSAPEAAAVRVRAPEGSAHGFLVLRGTNLDPLAEGDWWQIVNGDRLEAHLRFRFTNGSLSHETFELQQRGVWKLLTYRSIQRGPSFPRDIDAQLNRDSGHYRVETKDRGKSDSKVDEGTIEVPDDAYPFGLLGLLLKNLKRGESIRAHAVAFTPKPRVLKLDVSPDGDESVSIHGLPRKTLRYVAKAELGGPLGAVASIAGKQPPALHCWMAGDPVPTFVRLDGPLYPDGPIWRAELAAPTWPDAKQHTR